MKLELFPLVALIACAIIIALPAADRCTPLPPDETIRSAEMCGCSIQQQAPPDTYWYVRVWTRSSSGEKWEKFYSARPSDELRKALGDCDKWLECIRKAETKLRRNPQ